MVKLFRMMKDDVESEYKTFGLLDRALSEMAIMFLNPELWDIATEQTLKHHCKDMIAFVRHYRPDLLEGIKGDY